jgi:hypothetical protein
MPSFDLAALGQGYTGTTFADGLAATWHVGLSPRKKATFPGEPWYWASHGTAHPAKNQTITIDLVWNQQGDLQSLSCRATTGYTAFLRACASLDYPGARPQAVLDWLRTTTPKMDAAYTAYAPDPAVSPLYRDSRAAIYLGEQNVKEFGGQCRTLTIFGASPGTKL